MMKPAICAWLSSPRMIWRMMCSISSWNTSRCSTVRWMASATVICFISFPLDEILQHFVPVFSEKGFGMELHALDRQAAVAHAHDFAVLGFGGGRQAFRHRFTPHQATSVGRSAEAERALAT